MTGGGETRSEVEAAFVKERVNEKVSELLEKL